MKATVLKTLYPRLLAAPSQLPVERPARAVLDGEIVSRGTRTNKVKGGSVHIN